MAAINRNQVLIELARAGLLTPERSLIVRSDHPHVVQRALEKWGAPLSVHQAAGVIPFELSDSVLAYAEIQRQIDLHLTRLGDRLCKFIWIQDRLNFMIDLVWMPHMMTVQSGVPPHGFSQLAAKILSLRNNPIWEPMAVLLEHQIEPFGPRTLPTGERRFQIYAINSVYGVA